MKKVVMGMSGGVDSSVGAYLLKKEGFEVIGLFMRNWDSTVNNDNLGNPNYNNESICPQEQDYNDALKVCQELNIPLHRADFIKEYWDYVFNFFLEELKLGRTPNPDMMCNKYIKFDLFKKEALKLGADYIAMGHYARMEDGKLLRGVDTNKDQSYFLAQVDEKHLQNVLFPVGELNKEEVRAIANKLKLTTATKKDSTGICFIGERNFQKFLNNYLKPTVGDIVNVETKEVIGKHQGVIFYTIGQRKGVGLSGDATRHYVCGKDVKNNILYVAFGNDNEHLLSDACLINNLNFISQMRPLECTAKFRYRGKDHNVKLEYLKNNEILVHYDELASAVTPGQACVLYLGEECLGSGIIQEVYKNNHKLWFL